MVSMIETPFSYLTSADRLPKIGKTLVDEVSVVVCEESLLHAAITRATKTAAHEKICFVFIIIYEVIFLNRWLEEYVCAGYPPKHVDVPDTLI